MAIRLEQTHPSLVHWPIALLPLAVGTDLLGSITGNRSMLDFGRRAIQAAVAVASALTGLIAQEEINSKGGTVDRLVTHHNLNAAATLVATGMAVWRARREAPNALYMATGAIGIGVVTYTAYLGGQLVYEAGAAVGPAHGVARPDAPTLRIRELPRFVKAAAADIVQGARHMAQELAEGRLVPALTNRARIEPPSRQAEPQRASVRELT